MAYDNDFKVSYDIVQILVAFNSKMVLWTSANFLHPTDGYVQNL